MPRKEQEYDGLIGTITLKVTGEKIEIDGTAPDTVKLEGPDSDVYTLTIPNTRKKQNVSVIKTDASGDPLPGAIFALYKAEDYDDSTEKPKAETTPVISGDVGSDGKLALEELTTGSYRLVETQAPAGYIPITSAITIAVTADGVTATQGEKSFEVKMIATGNTSQITWQISVPNTPGVQLPSTGGMGTAPIYAAGAAMVLLALTMLLKKRRQHCD